MFFYFPFQSVFLLFSPVDLLFIVFSQDLRFYMKEMLGFSDQELKAMLLAAPKVYLSGMYTV